jgi:hypothetical protein
MALLIQVFLGDSSVLQIRSEGVPNFDINKPVNFSPNRSSGMKCLKNESLEK